MAQGGAQQKQNLGPNGTSSYGNGLQPKDAKNAIAFLSVVNNSRNAANDNNEPMSDADPLAEERPRSPLELPEQSYAQAVELQAQRQREARMVQTAEQFVGAPVVPSAAQNRPTQTTEAAAQRQQRRVTEEQEEPTDIAQARELSRQQTETLKQRQKTVQAQNEAAQKGAIEDHRKHLEKIWRFLNGLDTVTAEDIVNGLIAVAMMNAQLVNQLTLKNYDMVPKLSVVELFLVTFVDCILCTSVIPVLIPMCLVFIIIISAAFLGITGLTDILKI